MHHGTMIRRSTPHIITARSRKKTSRNVVSMMTIALLLVFLVLHLGSQTTNSSLRGFITAVTWTQPFEAKLALPLPDNVDKQVMVGPSMKSSNTHSTLNDLPLHVMLNITAQKLSTRNISRNLCGLIPKASPKATRFPRILAITDDSHEDGKPSCRANAILYLVQKGKHATYGRDSSAFFLKSLDLLYDNYLSINRHYDNTDILVFHSGDYDNDDLLFFHQRYNQTVHFKFIDLNETDYWTVPTYLQFDNTSQWAHPTTFSIGYRHMMRWYGLTLYDFARDYATMEGGCSYQYLMRMDEDSFLYSPIEYDLFDFMHSHNYSYAFRTCSYEMETEVWSSYMDHLDYCNASLPKGTPYRHISERMCGFYNNFFILDVNFVLQPEVQHFLQWIDSIGIIYRDRYNDLRIQSIAVYAFLPPERIHRFLDWTYEHMTSSRRCPTWGVLQAGYLDRNASIHFDRMKAQYRVGRRSCPMQHMPMIAKNLSPTYSHLPPSSWWKEVLSIPMEAFLWQTFSAGSVEIRGRAIMSG